MVCKHLQQLEEELIEAGIEETYRGQAWSKNCREWVYFDCYLDRDSIKKRLTFPEYVSEHQHRGTHDGQESGYVCNKCKDAIMGHYSPQTTSRIFK